MDKKPTLGFVQWSFGITQRNHTKSKKWDPKIALTRPTASLPPMKMVVMFCFWQLECLWAGTNQEWVWLKSGGWLTEIVLFEHELQCSPLSVIVKADNRLSKSMSDACTSNPELGTSANSAANSFSSSASSNWLPVISAEGLKTHYRAEQRY